MKIYLTLDYELFLGSITGSVENCLLKPMEYLCSIADKHNIKFTLFVDATYFLVLKEFNKYPQINSDYESIVKHLIFLKQQGHSIQLHIHPHWAYSEYDGKTWIVPIEHYKLSDIPYSEAADIITKSKNALEEIIDDKVTAFRAGGFSIQPFEPYAKLFEGLKIKNDSSVLCGCHYDSDNQQYDYRAAPYTDYYQFNKDICIADKKGIFNEYPISTHITSPLFWWKLSLLKIFNTKEQKIFGDGKSIETTPESIISRLTKPQMGFACMDGYKASLLVKMYHQQIKKFGEKANFVVMGHPKLATLFSLRALDRFISSCFKFDTFKTL
jgi:peptidoglycan/xylan/chitin deacetylase (PgdA/CDA1 family)